jgi:CO dehydrogenase maturation factor
MKLAYVGKGGSGKTTISTLFCRFLASQNLPVLAFDADINQHLGQALGLSETEAAAIPPLGQDLDRIKSYLRGSNPRIASDAVMTKTTPPGRGSRFWRVSEPNPLVAHFGRSIHGVTVLATGPFDQQDLGIKCYHSKVGAVELLLNHCLEGPDEYVVVDMTAGADSFASGLFTRFDLTFLVVEPTNRAVSVYQQYKAYCAGFNVKLAVIGNKIETPDDLTFIREQVGEDWLTAIARSDYVRALEKGQPLPFSQLEPENRQALALMQQAIQQCEQDWELKYRQAVFFHQKNATAWMNAALGEDVSQQIDPNFTFSSILQTA